jgi:hypothetical protein
VRRRRGSLGLDLVPPCVDLARRGGSHAQRLVGGGGYLPSRSPVFGDSGSWTADLALQPVSSRPVVARRRTLVVRTHGARRGRAVQLGGSGVRQLVVSVAAGEVGQQRHCLAALDFGGLGLDAWLRPCAALMARSGDKSRLAMAATRSMQGLGALAKALPFFGLMTATPSGAVASLEASIDLLPLLAWYFSS